MIMKKIFKLFCGALLVFNITQAQQLPRYEIGINAGVLSGIEIRYSVSTQWGLGIQAGGVQLNLENIRQTLAEQPTLIGLQARWLSAGITVDRALGTPKVRLKTGLFYCLKGEFEYEIVPDRSFTVAGTTYQSADLGSVTMAFSPTQLQPYLGLDFRFPIARKLLLGGSVGAWYLHHFTPTLSSNGFLSFRADALPNLQRNLDTYKVFPQLALGLHIQL